MPASVWTKSGRKSRPAIWCFTARVNARSTIIIRKLPLKYTGCTFQAARFYRFWTKLDFPSPKSSSAAFPFIIRSCFARSSWSCS